VSIDFGRSPALDSDGREQPATADGETESGLRLPVKGDGFGAAFSHAFTGKLEAVGVMDEAIENGVGDRGVSDGSMPGVHGS
jgi:hypothetical protein